MLKSLKSLLLFSCSKARTPFPSERLLCSSATKRSQQQHAIAIIVCKRNWPLRSVWPRKWTKSYSRMISMVSPQIFVCKLLCQFVPWAHSGAFFDAMGQRVKTCQNNLEICQIDIWQIDIRLISGWYQIGSLGSLKPQISEITVTGSHRQYWDYAELTNGAAGRRYVGAEDRAEGKRHIEVVRNSERFEKQTTEAKRKKRQKIHDLKKKSKDFWSKRR